MLPSWWRNLVRGNRGKVKPAGRRGGGPKASVRLQLEPLEDRTCPSTLTAIAVTPANATAVAGQNQTFIATGTFSNPTSTLALSAPVVMGSVSLGSASVGQVAVNPTTSQVYVGSGYVSGALQVVNASNPGSPTIVTSATVPQGWGAVYDPDNNDYYTGEGHGGNVYVYNSANNALVTTISLDPAGQLGYIPGGFAVDTTLNYIYVECQSGQQTVELYVINGSNNTILTGPLASGGVNGYPVANWTSTTDKVYVPDDVSPASINTPFYSAPTFSSSASNDVQSESIIAPTPSRINFLRSARGRASRS